MWSGHRLTCQDTPTAALGLSLLASSWVMMPCLLPVYCYLLLLRYWSKRNCFSFAVVRVAGSLCFVFFSLLFLHLYFFLLFVSSPSLFFFLPFASSLLFPLWLAEIISHTFLCISVSLTVFHFLLLFYLSLLLLLRYSSSSRPEQYTFSSTINIIVALADLVEFPHYTVWLAGPGYHPLASSWFLFSLLYSVRH